jgi:hypothetical protein
MTLEWRVDAPWGCARCHRQEAHEDAIYVGWAFVNGRRGEPYAFCEECYLEYYSADQATQRRMLDLVALRLTRVGAHA